MEENREKSVRPQNKNLKPGGPGRPRGQRNYATIYREALIRIADANDKTPEEIETMLEEVGLKQGLKGNFAFWKDIRDRIHGKAQENVNMSVEFPQPLLGGLTNDKGNDSNEETSETQEED